MEYTEDEILDVVTRWENTGLLYGLPLHEKQELAPIFDNISRMALSLTDKNKISIQTLEKLTIRKTQLLISVLILLTLMKMKS
jgi:hypothetical protein